MSYFIVQVQTNFEKYVLSLLAQKIDNQNTNLIKSIYALDLKVEFNEQVDLENVRQYLKEKRLRDHLSNLRFTYSQYKHKLSGIDREFYKEQIRDITNQLKQYSKNKTKSNKTTFIRGYIIVETVNDCSVIPSDIYHEIKSTPKVLGIPNKYSIPKEEIDFYFSQINMKKEKVKMI